MAGLVPAIHVLAIEKEGVDARDIGGAEATPSFRRLSPGMTERKAGVTFRRQSTMNSFAPFGV
jgi:hypothetical protein